MVDKVWPSARDAVSDIRDGAMIHFGGFGGAGVPTRLIARISTALALAGSAGRTTGHSRAAGWLRAVGRTVSSPPQAASSKAVDSASPAMRR